MPRRSSRSRQRTKRRSLRPTAPEYVTLRRRGLNTTVNNYVPLRRRGLNTTVRAFVPEETRHNNINSMLREINTKRRKSLGETRRRSR
jgi:hypothetical protein